MEAQLLWEAFAKQYNLMPHQVKQFQQYYDLLQEANEQFDLTAITELSAVISYHFADSIKLGSFIPLGSVRMIVDVGSGAGCPGIPLKLAYPDLRVVLIEVNKKRVEFLKKVIHKLKLLHVEVYTSDWRTFLRKTQCPVQLFCARASLRPHELIRMFQAGCFYRNAHLVYWAAVDWEATEKESQFLIQEFSYSIEHKQRKYVLFSKNYLPFTCATGEKIESPY
jgi:16S rRNA (guanine(527)-N(7))-methyltransferase RsmG